MQKNGYFITQDEMREQYEESLLNEIRKRDNKIQMLITLVAGLITLNLLFFAVIIFFR